MTAISLHSGGNLNSFVGISALVRTLAEFTLGVLLYRAHLVDAKFPRWWAAVVSILLACIALVLRLDFFMVGAFACRIYYAAGATGPFERLLDSLPLVALGNWSYSIYLWHAPTHYAVMAAFAGLGYSVGSLGLANARLLLFSTCFAVIVVSAFHHHYLEKPIRRIVVGAPSSAL